MSIQFRRTEARSPTPITTGQPKIQPHIRWLIRHDMREILSIERGTPDPWDDDRITRLMRQRNIIGMVAEHAGFAVGYMIYELHPASIRLIRLAVHPAWRLAGVGEAMNDKLLGKLSHHRRRLMWCEVPEGGDHLGMHLFLQRCGWVATGIIEDRGSIVFEWRLEA